MTCTNDRTCWLNVLRRLIVLLLVVLSPPGCGSTSSMLPPNLADTPAPRAVNGAKDDWWLARHSAKVQLAQTTNPSIVLIGDSITHYWEREGRSVIASNFADGDVLNLGFSADRTEQVLWRLRNGALADIQPKIIVLMIGTNNTGHRMDPAEYTANAVETIVQDISSQLPDATLVLVGILPRNLSPFNEMRRRNDAINVRLEDMSDGDRIIYIDCGVAFLNDDRTLRMDLMPDALHPNSKGYETWGDQLFPVIKGLLDTENY